MINAGYFRTPTVAGDTVVFVTEDDLWRAPLDGGRAERLTAGLGGVRSPRLSADGEQLAFSSREEWHTEVYVMPTAGGQAKRLTFLGATSIVVGWMPDGRIVFESNASQPFQRIYTLRAVDPKTGDMEELPFGPASEIAYGPDGAVVIGRNTGDPARWKRYRGGTAGQLWIDPKGAGSFKPLRQGEGNCAHPMWVGGRVYFVDDHEGIGNIYSCTRTGRDLERHTDHGEHYARFAHSDGTTIVYAHAAEIWALDEGADEPRRIDIELGSPRTQRNRKFVTATSNLFDAELSPDGTSIAIEARGRVASMSLWEGPVREHGGKSGVRYRLGRWLPDGDRIVLISDDGGEEALEIHRRDGKRKRFDDLDLGQVSELAVSPKGNKAAVVNQRLELILVDLDSGKSKVLDRSEYERMGAPAWSPDGRWIAYSIQVTEMTRSIAIADVTNGKTHRITGTEFRDMAPAWDPAGRYLYFVSYRHFDPVPDAHFFELSFPRGSRPFVVALRKDVRNPLLPERSGVNIDDDDDDDDKGSKKKDAKEFSIAIDFDGIQQRVEAIPVDEGRYLRLAATKTKLLMLSLPVRGSLADEEEDSEGGQITAYDFTRQKDETLIESGAEDLAVSRDGSAMLVMYRNKLRVLKAGRRPESGSERKGPGRESGWLDLRRIRLSIDPGAEWVQMYHEAWRLQRDNFWTADMSGVDWERIRERYRPLVDKVATRIEFSDLIWEMQGELGTSHCYEMGGDHRRPPAYRLGLLGADLAWDDTAKGWRIEHIVRGDAWDDEARSPFAEIGVNVREGDTILAVNGKRVSRSVRPEELLVHQAGQRVELRIGDAQGKKPRAVEIETLTQDTTARYREWVERNRRAVHEATNGRVGYVHIPNMGVEGFSEFHRYFMSELARDGLVVDVRYNGGGNVSQIILEKLARRRLGYDVPRWGAPESYPSDTMIGPLVCLTNEHAGSDGDIFTHGFKMLKIGPVVGKRTWGGVIGIWPRHVLADGGYTTQPEFSFWFRDVGFGVENYGTDPDFDVDIAPQDYARGKDPQMDKALSLIKAALKKTKPAVPDFGKRPDLSLPTLPPRA